APGTVVGANGVQVEAVAGVLRVALIDECQASAEAVLRRDAANGNVHGMVREKRFSTTQRRFKAGATAGEVFAFPAKTGAKLRLVWRQSRCCTSQKQKCKPSKLHLDSLARGLFLPPCGCKTAITFFEYSLTSPSVLTVLKSIDKRATTLARWRLTFSAC